MQQRKRRPKPDYGLKELDTESFTNKYLDLSPRADYIDGLRQQKAADDQRRARTKGSRKKYKFGVPKKSAGLNTDIVTTPKTKNEK